MATEKIEPRVIGAVLATGLMSLSGVIIETAMNITFPTLMKQFGVTTGTVQWMTTLYLLIVACIVPISSFLKRRFKMRQLFVAANLLFITGLLVDALAPAFVWLLVGRAIQAVGTGIALPLMFNIILEQVPLSRIGMMTGVGTLITAVGPAIGPTYGGILVTSLNWRYIFWILLPFLIVSFFVGLKTIQQVSPISHERFDMLSMLAVIATLGGLIYGFSSLGSQPLLSWSVLGAWIVGIFGLLGFVFRSNHVEHPLINLDTVKNSAFAWHLAAFFLLQTTALGLSFILPNYLQLVDKQTAFIAGLVVLPGAVIGAAFSPIGGQILDRFGAKKPIVLGLSIVTVTLILLTAFARQLPVWAVLSLYIAYMIGIGTAFGNIMTAGLKQLRGDLKADGNALMNAMQQFAGALGTAVVSMIISASQASGQGSTGVKTAVGSQWALLVLVVTGALALLSMLMAFKLSRPTRTR
ncbi:DHA2 family efflux MFS transporter permease subunit [Levilactobacillus sp. N40-8-2]|uniref:DHA2 family efflux MFS transporter permease subunit n=1 Tax=Levilactobacillus muriae TaxID=3238987 RepID=UPI0038B29CD6